MSVEETIKSWRGESTVIQYDRPSGAWIVIAVHSSVLGPASGGTRLKSYPNLAEAGGANNQLAEADDADRLRARHILYAPDYVLNIGGAMSAAAQELEGLSRAAAYERVKSVKSTAQQIFTIAEAEGITTAAAARRIAEARLSNPKSS